MLKLQKPVSCVQSIIFNAVEQFGGVTMLTEPETTLNYAPERTDPLTIYKEVIIPDLEYAVEWLAVGTHATTTVPTKKGSFGIFGKGLFANL